MLNQGRSAAGLEQTLAIPHELFGEGRDRFRAESVIHNQAAHLMDED